MQVENFVECANCDGYGRFEVGNILYDNCPVCKKKRIEKAFMQKCFKNRNGEPIDKGFINSLHSLGNITDDIFKLSDEKPRAALLIGSSGIGKSQLLRFWYNEKLKDANCESSRLFYATEKQLFNVFRSENEYEIINFFERHNFESNRYAHIFLDEFFFPVNYVDRNSDRHYAIQKHTYMWQFVDTLYDLGVPVTIATNTDPVTGKMPVTGRPMFDLLNDNEAAFVRRILEITGNSERWKKLRKKSA